MSNAAFDGAWRSIVVGTLGVAADSEHIRDLQTVIDAWQWRCSAKDEASSPHVSRGKFNDALKHFRAMAAAIALARGKTDLDITSAPLGGKVVPPGVAMASLEAYLKRHATNGAGSRVRPKSADSLLIHQIAVIWEAAGKPVPRTWDARSSEFSRFVEFVISEVVSKRAADRGLKNYFQARDIYAARNRQFDSA
jgi:hypothetical protein